MAIVLGPAESGRLLALANNTSPGLQRTVASRLAQKHTSDRYTNHFPASLSLALLTAALEPAALHLHLA